MSYPCVPRVGQNGEQEAHAKHFDLVRYENAGHAFFSDTRPSYRPEVAYMAWGRCLEWLSRHLKL
jgi:dienelactone hydrolase